MWPVHNTWGSEGSLPGHGIIISAESTLKSSTYQTSTHTSVRATQCMHAHVHVPEHASSIQATQKTLPNIANGLGVHAVLFGQGVTSGPKKIRICWPLVVDFPGLQTSFRVDVRYKI